MRVKKFHSYIIFLLDVFVEEIFERKDMWHVFEQSVGISRIIHSIVNKIKVKIPQDGRDLLVSAFGIKEIGQTLSGLFEKRIIVDVNKEIFKKRFDLVQIDLAVLSVELNPTGEALDGALDDLETTRVGRWRARESVETIEQVENVLGDEAKVFL